MQARNRSKLIFLPFVLLTVAAWRQPIAAGAETLNLEFGEAAGTLLDKAGVGTGFTDRLPLTSSPETDPLLALNVDEKQLELTSSQADFNGGTGIDHLSAPGVKLTSLGFTGNEDFTVRVVFKPLPELENIDQVGLYVGRDAKNLTRAGVIRFDAPEYLSVHTTDSVDNNAHFFGAGLDVTDGMEVIIRRTNGDWEYLIDGAAWQPNTAADGSGNPVNPDGENGSPDLNAAKDLYAGVYAITVFNDHAKSVPIESFEITVEEPSESVAAESHSAEISTITTE
jgi:hypothetical protein